MSDSILPTPIRTKRAYTRRVRLIPPVNRNEDVPVQPDDTFGWPGPQMQPLLDRIEALEATIERLATIAIARKEPSAVNVWAFERREPALKAEKAARKAARMAAQQAEAAAAQEQKAARLVEAVEAEARALGLLE